MFVGIAILCDDYFVPVLEDISAALKLSDDVAGATFMAAGSSAPELFTSLAGVTVDSDVGVGTIVGSAVFNILVIIAMSAAFGSSGGKGAMQVDWRCIVRDSFHYGVSIVVLIIFLWDGRITWWESVILIALYFVYLLNMKFNQVSVTNRVRNAAAAAADATVAQLSPHLRQACHICARLQLRPLNLCAASVCCRKYSGTFLCIRVRRSGPPQQRWTRTRLSTPPPTYAKPLLSQSPPMMTVGTRPRSRTLRAVRRHR